MPADRFNQGKPKLSYTFIGREAVEGEARVWEYGAQKYSRGNWLKGLPFTEACDSLLRHTLAFLNGEDIDPESGLPHVDFMHVNAKMIAQHYRIHPELDDRGDEQ